MQVLKHQIKESIEYSAKTLFLINGFETTSIKTIAKYAGTTKGNIYSYFRSKEDILISIVTPTIKSIENLLDSIISTNKNLSRTTSNYFKTNFSLFFSKEAVIFFTLKNAEFVSKKTLIFQKIQALLYKNKNINFDYLPYIEIYFEVLIRKAKDLYMKNDCIQYKDMELYFRFFLYGSSCFTKFKPF